MKKKIVFLFSLFLITILFIPPSLGVTVTKPTYEKRRFGFWYSENFGLHQDLLDWFKQRPYFSLIYLAVDTDQFIVDDNNMRTFVKTQMCPFFEQYDIALGLAFATFDFCDSTKRQAVLDSIDILLPECQVPLSEGFITHDLEFSACVPDTESGWKTVFDFWYDEFKNRGIPYKTWARWMSEETLNKVPPDFLWYDGNNAPCCDKSPESPIPGSNWCPHTQACLDYHPFQHLSSTDPNVGFMGGLQGLVQYECRENWEDSNWCGHGDYYLDLQFEEYDRVTGRGQSAAQLAPFMSQAIEVNVYPWNFVGRDPYKYDSDFEKLVLDKYWENVQPRSDTYLWNKFGPTPTETTTTIGTTSTTTPTTSSTSSTTTTLPAGQVSISGRLRNATETIDANVTAYNQGTDQINASQITSGGNYSLAVWPDIYDLQYGILDFFVPNFWIKLISLSITSNLQDVINYVTSYPSENITFTVNITTDQEIQVYSEDKPKTVKANGIEMSEGTLPLSANEWFYNSTEQKLYMIASPVLPATTTTVLTTTTTIPGTTTTTTLTTTTIPITALTWNFDSMAVDTSPPTGWSSPSSGAGSTAWNFLVVSDSSSEHTLPNSAKLTTTYTGGSSWVVSTAGTLNPNYTIETKVKFDVDGSGSAGIIYSSGIAAYSSPYYILSIDSSGMSLSYHPSNTWTINELDSWSGSLTSNTWYKIRLDRYGCDLRGFLNDELKVSISDCSITSGQPGVYGYYRSGYPITAHYFDDISATR